MELFKPKFLQWILFLSYFSSSAGFRQPLKIARTFNIKRSQLKATEINSWLIEKGAMKDNMKVILQNDGVKSFGIATSDLKKNDLLLSVPQSIFIDAAKAKKKFGDSINENDLRTGDFGMIALFLLSEKQAGEKSDYSIYINSLPLKPPGILSWTQNQLNLLFKSTTRQVERQVKAVEDDIDFILSNVQHQSLPKEIITSEQLRWAFGIVKAKYFLIDNKPTLIPGVDFIDFDPLASNEPFTASTIWSGKTLKLNTDREYKQGDPLFLSCGLKNAAECLEDHGIIPIFPLSDSTCEIKVSIDESDKFSNDKINIMEDNGFSASERFDLEASAPDGLNTDLVTVLRLKLINGTDSFILEPVFMNTVYSTLGLPFSKPNELAVTKYLKNFCETAIARKNEISSREEDFKFYEKMESESNSDIIGLETSVEDRIKLLRTQERMALEETLKIVNAEILSLQSTTDPREYYQERRLLELNLLRPLDDDEVFMPGDRPPLDDDY